MSKNRKIALTLALTLGLTISSVSNAFAVPSQEELDKVIAQIGQLDSDIIQNIDKLDKLNAEINSKEIEITNKQEQIAKLQSDIEKEQDLYNQRLRNYYINNNIGSFVTVMLESKNFSDFIDRIDTIKSIAQYDKDLKANLKDSISNTEKEKKSLETMLSAVNNDKLQVEADQQTLEAKKTEATNLMNTYKDEIKAEEDRIEQEKQAEIQKIEQEKLAQEEAAREKAQSNPIPDNKPSRGDDVTTPQGSYALGDEMVAYAKQFLGTPYVWGANGPDSFDCSGFTRYVYRHFGISLPRVAADQQDTGRAVSYDELRPGDLVFFGNPAHHVGIYVGGGKYIHAPQDNDVVKISNLATARDFSGGRRYYSD